MGPGTLLNATPRLKMLLAGAGALLLEGFLAGSMAPSAAGFLLILYLLHAHHGARDRFRAAHVQAERHLLESIVHEGSACTLVLDTRASRPGPGVGIAFTDVLSRDLEAADPIHLAAPGRLQYRAVPRARGQMSLLAVRVTLTDHRGLWREVRLYPLATHIQVHPPKETLDMGRRLAKRTPFDATSPHPLALLVRDFEYETSRPFSHGDRLRDVDWKRVSAGRGILSKQWEREQEANVILLLDAGRTMRSRAGADSSLDQAASLMLQMVEVATQKNFPVGIVIHDETQVLEEIAPSRDRLLPQRLSRAVMDLPQRITALRRLDAGLPSDADVPEADLGFLAALGRWRDPALARPARGGPHMAMDRILRHGRGSRLLLVAFTDLESTPAATLKGLGRAAKEGHRAVAVVFPESRQTEGPLERMRDLENAYRRRASREKGRAMLRAQGVEVVELAVGDTAAPILVATQDRDAQRPRGGA